MKIENLRTENNQKRKRVIATVTWEDCDRAKSEVYFETDEEFANSLACNPHAFLVGCMIPAMHHAEKRVFVNAEICPELREGLITALSLLRHWYYGEDHELIRIECKRTRSLLPRQITRAGLFFSGGIDSLSSLRLNRLIYPLDHRRSFKDALILYGQNIESDNRPETFADALHAFANVIHDAGITLIPVYTNMRDLDIDLDLFLHKSHSSILSAVAHAFAPRLTALTISSTFDIKALHKPWGSHPLLDPNYSSDDLRIHHDDIAFTRLAKTKRVADWDVGLRNIRVCNNNWPGKNCGECEKCIRTMLALLALGVLEKTPSFPSIEITEQFLLSKFHLNDVSIHFYPELLPLLIDRGRHDLVRAIKLKMAEYFRAKRLSDCKEAIRRLDNDYLNGGLSRFKKRVFN
jgi:hypothetical protein